MLKMIYLLKDSFNALLGHSKHKKGEDRIALTFLLTEHITRHFKCSMYAAFYLETLFIKLKEIFRNNSVEALMFCTGKAQC